MRKIILQDVEAEKEEIRRELNIKEDKEVRNNQATSQPQQQYYQQYYQQQYQQPQQQNPFQTDTKYEFMLIAMNPIVGFMYQIFKGLAWLISGNKR
jgi:Tfp pilus assembly protein PilP